MGRGDPFVAEAELETSRRIPVDRRRQDHRFGSGFRLRLGLRLELRLGLGLFLWFAVLRCSRFVSRSRR